MYLTKINSDYYYYEFERSVQSTSGLIKDSETSSELL